MALGSIGNGETDFLAYASALVALPLLLFISWQLVRFIFLPLLTKFDKIQEYIFLLSIGWCLGMSELAVFFGLSHEIGAFIAGVSIASSPISLYIAQSLKPLRDFFLVLFFFTIGASLNLQMLPEVAIGAILIAGVLLVLKPLVFRFLLGNLSESKNLAWERTITES